MTVSLLTKWDGGIAEDPRTTNQDQSQNSENFDIFTNPHQLIPYGDSVAETVAGLNMSDIQIQDIDIVTISGTTYFVGAGYTGAGNLNTTFYTKVNINDAWGAQATVPTTPLVYQPNTGIVFQGKFYCIGVNGSTGQSYLLRFDGAGSITISTALTNNVVSKPFQHPSDNKMYIMSGNTIIQFDGTSFVNNTSLIGPGYYPVSYTDYGNYMAIAIQPVKGYGNAFVYMWDLIMTDAAFQVTVPLGEGSIRLIENLNNTLFIIMNPGGPALSVNQNKLVVKGYSGGAVSTMTTLQVPSSVGQVSTAKCKNASSVYFGFGNDTAIYRFGKNKEGQYILTKDRYYQNGLLCSGFRSVNIIGDTSFFGVVNSSTGFFSLMRSKINGLGETISYSSVSTFTTIINPVMGLSRYTVQDRHKTKQLEATLIEYEGVGTTGNMTLQYSIDGSNLQTIVNDTNSIGQKATEAVRQFDSQPLLSGREFEFVLSSSGGSKIKQVAYKYSPRETLL